MMNFMMFLLLQLCVYVNNYCYISHTVYACWTISQVRCYFYRPMGSSGALAGKVTIW